MTEEKSELISCLELTDRLLLHNQHFGETCVYCGNPYTEWDHFRPLGKNKMPTGYISEIHNLVPSCGKCNQSKGNINWKTWMLGNAPLSPHSLQIPDIEYRIAKLEEFEQHYTPIRLDFEKIVGTKM